MGSCKRPALSAARDTWRHGAWRELRDLVCPHRHSKPKKVNFVYIRPSNKASLTLSIPLLLMRAASACSSCQYFLLLFLGEHGGLPTPPSHGLVPVPRIHAICDSPPSLLEKLPRPRVPVVLDTPVPHHELITGVDAWVKVWGYGGGGGGYGCKGGVPLGLRGGIREVGWHHTHVPHHCPILGVTVPLPPRG